MSNTLNQFAVSTVPNMHKREFYAALAMHALITAGQESSPDDVAFAAVGYADRLVVALGQAGPVTSSKIRSADAGTFDSE